MCSAFCVWFSFHELWLHRGDNPSRHRESLEWPRHPVRPPFWVGSLTHDYPGAALLRNGPHGAPQQNRSVTVRLTTFFLLYVSEIEAKEACDWLRAAGFPQYAQLYEGTSFFTERTNSGQTMWALPSAFWVVALMRCGFAPFPLGLGNSKLIWTHLEMRALPFPPHFLLPTADSHPAPHFLPSVHPDSLCRLTCSSLF